VGDISGTAEAGPPLRAVEYDERFLEMSGRWLRDEEVRRLTMTPPFTHEQQRAWFAGLKGRDDYFVWGIELDGAPIGAFGIKNIEGRAGEYWGYIGEKSCWGRGVGSWLMEEARRRALALGLEQLYLRVWRENVRAIRLYTRFGFRPRSGGPADEALWMDCQL
jgi:RimJ/RimL family protein N-acetyltransferase